MTPWLPAEALAVVTWLIAAAVVLQTAELWVIRRAMGDDGVWAWSALRSPGRGASSDTGSADGAFADRVFGQRGVTVTLVARGLSAAIVPWLPPGPLCTVLLAVALVTTMLIALRWRGSFNGGSDAMTLHVLLAVTLHAAVPDSDAMTRGCVWYVAIVSVHSYALAGLAKIVHRPWRDGSALHAFVTTAVHVPPPVLLRGLAHPVVARLGAWTVMGLELAAPLALVDPRLCVGFVVIAAAFHVGNAWVFGLSRFVLPWLATYPALYACSALALS